MKTTAEILEELFDYGKSTYEFKIGNKYPIKIRNITTQDFLDMDESLKDNKMTKVGFSQVYILERVSRVILSINDKPFENVEKCKEYLQTMPSKFTDKILNEHKAFENVLKKALDLDEIDDHFFEEGASLTNSKQSQEESTSEPQDHSEKS